MKKILIYIFKIIPVFSSIMVIILSSVVLHKMYPQAHKGNFCFDLDCETQPQTDSIDDSKINEKNINYTIISPSPTPYFELDETKDESFVLLEKKLKNIIISNDFLQLISMIEPSFGNCLPEDGANFCDKPHSNNTPLYSLGYAGSEGGYSDQNTFIHSIKKFKDENKIDYQVNSTSQIVTFANGFTPNFWLRRK